jgi:hypothetical protein
MLTGIVLLYVGAALLVNGIWLIGQAQVADRPASESIHEMMDEPLEREPIISAGSSQATVRERRSAPSRHLTEKLISAFYKGEK